MVDSRIQAADAVHAAVANLRGAAKALAARASMEDDDLAAMIFESPDAQAARLSEAEEWLERDAGEDR